MGNSFVKDPDSVLDYKFDWSSWLAAGESISTYVVTPASGITNSTNASSSDSVTCWLSGGTAGSNYPVACKIVTDSSRTAERTMTIHVRQR